MLLRRITRPMFATWFVAEGLDAAAHPGPHVERIREGARALASYVPGDVQVLDRLAALPAGRLALLARAHGAATALAGVALATGRGPRTAAAALALLVAPTALVNIPPLGHDPAGPEQRRVRRDRLIRALAFAGGAALVAVDTEGRPGISYRVATARTAHRGSAASA